MRYSHVVGLAPEPAEGFVGGDKGFLGGLFGVMGIAQDPVGNVVDEVPVLLHYGLEIFHSGRATSLIGG